MSTEYVANEVKTLEEHIHEFEQKISRLEQSWKNKSQELEKKERALNRLVDNFILEANNNGKEYYVDTIKNVLNTINQEIQTRENELQQLQNKKVIIYISSTDQTITVISMEQTS